MFCCYAYTFTLHNALSFLAYVLRHACSSAPAFHDYLFPILYLRSSTQPLAICWYCMVLAAANKSFERLICLVLLGVEHVVCPKA